VFHLQNKTNRKVATLDFYEDFDEDELYDPENYYLSEAKIDNLIHTIRMYGSKYKYLDIEKLILETDEESVLQWSQVFEWIRDPNGSKRLTFNKIEELLDAKHLKLKTTTPTITPPFHHETASRSTLSAPIPTIKDTAIQKQAIKNSTIFPGELKVLFTKAAFQQWKIATQTKKIEENNKIIKSFQLSPNATIFIPALQSAFESTPKDPILSLTAPLSLPK